MILLYQIKRDKRDKFRPGKKFFGKAKTSYDTIPTHPRHISDTRVFFFCAKI